MGQQQSTPVQGESRINALSRGVFSEIEKYTFEQKKINDDGLLFMELGLGPGSGIAITSAQFLAAYPYSMSRTGSIHDNIFKVIGFYNSRLVEALKLDSEDYTKLLFLSFAVQCPNEVIDPLEADFSKYYIQYMDFFNFVTLMCGCYDQNPATWPMPFIGVDQSNAAELMLEGFKGPIINYTQFKEFLARFPYILTCLDVFWSRLLFDKPSDPELDPAHAASTLKLLKSTPTALKPHEICVLYMARGPKVTQAIKLYQAKNDGFSMRAFESKVVNWKAPTILVLRGKRLTKPNGSLDASVPKVTDSTERTSNRVAFAIFVDSPWKVSNKKGFAEHKTTIYQIEPQFSQFAVAPAAPEAGIGYFSPDVGGIGFGLPPPQSKTIVFQRNANIAMVIDRFLENGVFRCIGPGGTFYPDTLQSLPPLPYEDRFAIANIEAWGIGDEAVLAKQQREWDWEKRESIRRQNVNVGEDRAILELAGIVGQYDPNRGTS